MSCPLSNRAFLITPLPILPKQSSRLVYDLSHPSPPQSDNVLTLIPSDELHQPVQTLPLHLPPRFPQFRLLTLTLSAEKSQRSLVIPPPGTRTMTCCCAISRSSKSWAGRTLPITVCYILFLALLFSFVFLVFLCDSVTL